MAVDLHIHTNASDGVHTPEEVVALAKTASLDAIAITDHDAIDGFVKAKEAAKYKNIEIIPGIELSTEYNNDDLHILGYCLDVTKQEFLTKLNELNKKREERAIRIIYKLFTLGIKLDLENVIKFSDSAPIGRPHIAKAMIETGIVKTKEEAFTKYIGTGKPAYVPLTTITPLEAVKLVLLANGVPVLAHPGINPNAITLLEQLILGGLRGIEVYHPEHTIKQIKRYTKIAKKNNLIMTGGTDFHGDYGIHRHKIGAFSVDYAVVEELKRISNELLTL